jgi:hypothetical protein
LLGCHIGQGADTGIRRGKTGGSPLDTRDSEVADLDRAVVEQHEIGRLDIAVDHSGPVCGGKSVGDLAPVPQDAVDRQPVRALGEHASQIPAVEQFQDEERPPVVPPDVVHHGDAAMVEPGRRSSLAEETLLYLLGNPAPVREQLHCDGPVQFQVGTAPDLSHAASSEQSVQTVPPGEHVSIAHCQPPVPPGSADPRRSKPNPPSALFDR